MKNDILNLGEIECFPKVEPSKNQVLKILEEAAEVYAAWQTWDKAKYCAGDSSLTEDSRIVIDNLIEASKLDILNECADVIQACSNLIKSLDVNDFSIYMLACKARNVERGRM